MNNVQTVRLARLATIRTSLCLDALSSFPVNSELAYQNQCAEETRNIGADYKEILWRF